MSTKITIAIILILLVVGIAGYVRGGQPRTVHVTSAAIPMLLGDDAGMVWIEAAPPAAPSQPATPDPVAEPDLATGGALYSLPRGETTPRCLYAEPCVVDFVPADDVVVAVVRDGDAGAVVSIPRAGGNPTTIADGLARPRGVIAEGGATYWTETRGSAAEHVTHLATVGARTTVMMAAAGADPSPVAAFACAGDEFGGELLGVHDGQALWLDRVRGGNAGIGWAFVRSAPTAGGPVVTVTAERSGLNHALLEEGTLYYTAPSDDAGAPLNYRAVRRMSLADGAVETLSDWLPHGSRPVRHDGTLYCIAHGGTWVVPETLGPPRLEGKHRAGGRMGAVVGGRLYEVSPVPGRTAIVCVPVTVSARFAAALAGGDAAPEGPDAP